jgi:hypothetical protein
MISYYKTSIFQNKFLWGGGGGCGAVDSAVIQKRSSDLLELLL